ncbi:MAG: DUF748 domain-containing protein [Opitutaceae bacterium]|nr:DUF748 domain-containing protein [Opitutaceae bacterium]
MKPASKLRRRLLIVAGLIALYTVVGFFLAPVIVKSQLEKRLSAELGRRVTVEKVRTNPYAISLTLENFAIRERDGASKFVDWRRLYVDVDVWTSIWSAWSLGEIDLEGFDARIAVNADSSLNFADILTKLDRPAATPAPSPAAAKPGRPVRVGRLHVANARIDFSDAAARRPFATTLGPVTFTLTNFHTTSETGAPHHFEAVTEAGEKFTWTGTLHATPPRSRGEFSLEQIVLAKYMPYYPHQVNAEIAGGTLSVRGRYEAGLEAGKTVLRLLDGAVQVRGLKVLESPRGEAALELAALDVNGIQADAMSQQAKIASVTLNGGLARLRREKDGTLNVQTMLQPDPAAPRRATAPATPGPTAPPAPGPAIKPDVTVGELALKDFRVEVADLAAPQPAKLAVSGLEFSLRDITLAEGAKMPLQFAASWAPGGTVRLAGLVGIAPAVSAQLELDVAGLDLLPLNPYLETFANVDLTQGVLTTKLKLGAELRTGQPLTATVAGDVTVEKFALVDGTHSEELAGFQSLALRGLRAATAPELSVGLDEVNIAGPYARVVVNADKSLNLATVARLTAAPAGTTAPVPATAPGASAAGPAAPPPKIDVAKVVITGGDYRFTDRSIEPHVTMAMSDFTGTVAGLSSANLAKADLDLKAVINGAGPVAITGKVDPLGAKPSFDLKVDFRNVDLVPLSPYSGKYAGYELARGKLVLDVKFLMDGKKIDAANVITLNQFTFGGKVASPEATTLPVRLGVALLKDLEGKIVIDVPVQGSTDDPSFGIGRVVWRVIGNLLTKAAVSPFSLLGAAFGGGGEELAFQEFPSGSDELLDTERKKLETMVKALTNRPGLNLDLQGSYDADADAYALKRVKLAGIVRRAIWQAKQQQDPNLPPPDKLVIAPEEHAAMLKKLYDEKFPPGPEFGAPLPKPPVVVAPPPPPPTGLLRRMVNAVTGQAKRDTAVAAQEKARVDAEQAQAAAAAEASGLPVEEMTGRLAEATPVDANDLRALAQARAQRVRDYFTNEGKIAADRIFLAKDTADAASQSKGPRVFLSLQ